MRPHILLLTPQLPYPPHQGTSLRNFHMLKALAQQHEVSLLSFAEGDQPQESEPLQTLCRVLPPVVVPTRNTTNRLKSLVTTWSPDMAMRLESTTFSDALARALQEKVYQAVQIEGIELAAYIPIVRQYAPDSRIVLDCHNAETELQRRALAIDRSTPSRWPAALYSRIQIGRLARFEAWAMHQSDAVFAVSQTDRSHLLELLPGSVKEITVIPNTIDTAEYAKPEKSGPEFSYDLVFTGKMDYRPNVDAVLWFAENVWPSVRRARPHTTWAIVGQRPHARLEPLRHVDGITLTGRVAAVHPYLHGSSVYIVPLRVGSGTRLKLIEAMAAGRPIISTAIGAEGFEVKDKDEIILAESADEWVESIISLLANEALRKKMSAAARKFAAQYDWRQIIPLIHDVYLNLLQTDDR